MNRPGCAGFLTLCSVAAMICAKGNDGGVLLKANYSAAKQWRYTVDYTSQGTFTQNLTSTTKATKIRGVLTGTKKDTNSFAVKVDSATVASALFKDNLSKEIRDKLLKSVYVFSLANGFPALDSTAEIPAEDYLGWDFYRQMARLLPTLPSKPVKPGFTWERTLEIPLKTSRGTVPCEVYRSYTFKKLRGDTAVIEWEFRYAAEEKPDSAKIMSQIPVSGKGSGTAQIDLSKSAILSTHVDFATPVAVVGNVSVTWQESADFRLVGEK